MGLTKNEKLFLFASVIVVVLYLVYTQKQKEGVENVKNNSDETDNNMVNSVIMEEDKTLQKSDSDELLLRKMTSKNSASGDTYKTINYAEGERNGSLSNLDAFFEQGNPLNGNENSNYMPNDDNNNYSLNIYSTKSAPYVGRPRKEISDEEKFNASELLPKEEKQDWFEDVTPQKIKNRHLINIYRPIGVNTVITSRKNPSLDLRGNPVNPKTFVSPFLNSSIEPDVNARGICI